MKCTEAPDGQPRAQLAQLGNDGERQESYVCQTLDQQSSKYVLDQQQQYHLQIC